MIASRSPACGLKTVGGYHFCRVPVSMKKRTDTQLYTARAPVLTLSSKAEVSFLKEMKLTWKQVAFQLLSGE